MGKTRKREPVQALSGPALPPVFYRLHTLLETVRVIKSYEDPLCTLLHAIKTAGDTSPEVERELQELLDEMPAAGYPREMDCVRELLETAPPGAATATQPAAVSRKRTVKAK